MYEDTSATQYRESIKKIQENQAIGIAPYSGTKSSIPQSPSGVIVSINELFEQIAGLLELSHELTNRLEVIMNPVSPATPQPAMAEPGKSPVHVIGRIDDCKDITLATQSAINSILDRIRL